MRKLWEKFKHNQGIVISTFIALAVVGWAYGCQASVQSILRPASRLNRTEFHGEVESIAAQVQSRYESLDRQDELKQKLFNLAIEYAQSGHINPLAVAITLGNIVGLGAVIDNRRKDVLIKTLKSNGPDKTQS